MKIAYLVSRILLGLVFFVFGLNGFFHFIPQGPLPGGLAGQFMTSMMQSGYMQAVAGFEVVGGLLLLAGQFVPLGLAILAPIIVNTILFHVFLMSMGLPIALLCALLWLLAAYYLRAHFAGLFAQKA